MATSQPPPMARADGVHVAPPGVSAGSPPRRAAATRSAVSEPATPSAGGKSPMNALRARHPSSRFASGARTPGGSVRAPPRRMSTRLQLTLRERLHSRRENTERTPSEVADENDDDDDDDDEDDDEKQSRDDDENSSSESSSDETPTAGSPTGMSSSPDKGQQRQPTERVRSKASMSARKRERQRLRRRRRWLRTVLGALVAIYYLLSVPLRFGLYFDPFFTAPYAKQWTRALTVFITLDAIADITSVALLAWKRLLERRRHMRRLRSQRDLQVESNEFVEGYEALSKPAPWLRWSDAIDVVAYFPVEIVLLATAQYNALHIARLTKLVALRSVPHALGEFIITTQSRPAVAPSIQGRVLGRFLAVVMAIGVVWVHWSALIYILIAHAECGLNLTRSTDCVSWAIDDQLRGVEDGGGGDSRFRIYSRAVYWASRTVITLGFSDAVANASRSTETFLMIFGEFVGAFWCACVIAGFAYWFTLQHRRGSKYSHEMFVHRVEHLLGRPHFGHSNAENALGSVVPKFLRRQIVEYLHHEWSTYRVFKEAEFRSSVRQEQLRQGLTCELKTTKLLRLPCFSRQSLGFLNAVAGEMKLVSLAPLDWIIEYPGTQSVFFVLVSGTVAVVSPDEEDQKVYTCNPGDCFGAITLYDPSVLREKAFAEDYSEILMLDSDGLDRVLKTYYHDRQSTAGQQREEMHKAAHDDYASFSERCRRRRDRRSVLGQQDVVTCAHIIPHWDKMQTEMECAPRVWVHPQSRFRVNWEALRCFALLYLTFEVPYNVVFYYGGTVASAFGPSGDWRFRTTFAISALVEVFFCVDFYIRCYSFLPRKAMKTRSFYLDAVANVPLALIVDIYDGCTVGSLPVGWKWLSLFRLIRLLRVRRLKKRIIATLPRANGVAQFIIYSAISILVYCHGVACIWFLAGHYGLPASSFPSSSNLPSKPDCLRMAQEYGNCTWTTMDGMETIYDSGDHRFVYLRSLYFSISTFTTVAYGDILPYSTLETWIAAVATFIGGVLCYVMFGAMGAALARLARRRRENRYENHLRARVLEMHGVSRRLRSEINRFQTFRANILADHELEQEVLKFVTPGLRGELSKYIHRPQARRLGFMHSAKPAFCDAIAACMTRRFYFSGDVIFSAGEVAKEVMVIRRGRVQLVDGDSSGVVASLADGGTLGERSFVTQTDPILVDYVAETLVEVSVLPREAIVELWKHFPGEMQRMTTDGGEGSNSESKHFPVVPSPMNDANHALSRIIIRHDSPNNSDDTDFETRVKWQRAINGNTFRSRWELVVGMVVVYNTFSIIARVAFIPAPSKATMIALTCIDYLFDVVLLVDIYLKSTRFLPPGDLLSVSTRIYEPKHIRSFYYREGWMVFDVLASIPLYYVGSNYALMTYFRLPRILRALQLVDIGERIHSGLLQRWTASTSSAGVAYSLVGLSKVLVVLLLFCHVGGSVFYAASSHESDTSGRAPWVRGDVVIAQHADNLGVAYLRSFYWAISTVTVVNYGDIVATTVRETLWTCLICLCGTFFMSKVIGDLVDLLQSLDQCATEHRERVEQFEYVAQRRDLPDELTERGQIYLYFEYEISHGLPPPEDLFCSLPSQLQAAVYDEMYGSILRRVPLFESLSDSQIRELAAAPWRTEVFLPSDVIVFENSLADSLYVMKHGRAEIIRFGSQLSISQIESGQLFGEAMFFISGEDHKGGGAGPRRMASVRALSFCEVLRLDRDAWLRFMGMRASNRVAGRRVLEIAQGEQLKSRTLLQKLESNISQNRRGSDEGVASDRSSFSGDEKRDVFDSPINHSGMQLRLGDRRDLRTASAPPVNAPPTDGTGSMRRIRSTPAAMLSHIVRSLSFTSGNRRQSDAYAALSTPTPLRALGSPTRESPRRHVKTRTNALRRFESSPMTPEHALERREGNGSRELDEPQPAPLLRFVDTSEFCYRWDAIKFFAILYYVAALPLRVSFYDDIERAAQKSSGNGDRVMTIWMICEYVFVDGFLWLDIFMRLFVFIPTVRGEPLMSRSERRRWYVRHGSFVLDVLGSFPLEVLSLLPVDAFHSDSDRGAIVAAGFRLTTLLRCFQLEPLWWRLERQLFWFQKDTLTIFKIAFIGVLSSHWIACLWYFVGHASMDSNSLSWLTAPNMLAPDPTGSGSPLSETDVDNVSMLNKYLRSYHYAIGSISTTTFGDIVSRNVPETFAQLVITFLCLVFYGYVTSGVRQILSRKFSRTIALEHNDAQIRRFARHYGLSRSLTSQIRLHLRERWRQESDVDQRAIAHLLHGPLRRAIASYLRSPLFETVEPRRLAFDSLPEVVVHTILAELREEAYLEGEVIYEQYAVGRVMYFVESGSVQLTTLSRDRSTHRCLKQQGEFFGESCVVDRATCGSERRETAIAQSESRLVVLDLDAYERVLTQFPTHAAAIQAAWSLQTSFAV